MQHSCLLVCLLENVNTENKRIPLRVLRRMKKKIELKMMKFRIKMNGMYARSAIALGSILRVWSGITLGVSIIGIILVGFLQKLEVNIIFENIGSLLPAKAFASILLAILLLGNLWGLTHYLEKDIKGVLPPKIVGALYVGVVGVVFGVVW
jgi:hypothetical protein